MEIYKILQDIINGNLNGELGGFTRYYLGSISRKIAWVCLAIIFTVAVLMMTSCTNKPPTVPTSEPLPTQAKPIPTNTPANPPGVILPGIPEPPFDCQTVRDVGVFSDHAQTSQKVASIPEGKLLTIEAVYPESETLNWYYIESAGWIKGYYCQQ